MADLIVLALLVCALMGAWHLKKRVPHSCSGNCQSCRACKTPINKETDQ